MSAQDILCLRCARRIVSCLCLNAAKRSRVEMRGSMEIRRARERDLSGVDSLLEQVCMVHHAGRPDLFQGNHNRKYTDEQLKEIFRDETRPVFVAVNEGQEVLGYAFCVLQHHPHDNVLTDIKTLYIDDLCVDENIRGQHIGSSLYQYVLQYAKEQGCYNVTLNVWTCNEPAMRFYEKCGMKAQKIGMETIL